MALFHDRREAGRRLAVALAAWRGTDAVAVGIARGGIPVAAEVARRLGLPLSAVAVRKLGVPGQEEYAWGAIADGVRVVHDDAVRRLPAAQRELIAIEDRERAVLATREALLDGAVAVAGRTAIVIDDGIATGATAEAACRAVRARGAMRVVLAAPVAPAQWRPPPDVADDWVCPCPRAEFCAVGAFYSDFTQTDDAEVERLLSRDDPGVVTSED